MKIAIASDHAGFLLKTEIIKYIGSLGHEVEDFGTDSEESMDYPDTIAPAAGAVAQGKADRGIVICGSGIGASIVANKVRGIRAALCSDAYDAEYSRLHNDSNVIVFGARKITAQTAVTMLDKWLNTEFEGGRHQRRVDKIANIESNTELNC